MAPPVEIEDKNYSIMGGGLEISGKDRRLADKLMIEFHTGDTLETLRIESKEVSLRKECLEKLYRDMKRKAWKDTVTMAKQLGVHVRSFSFDETNHAWTCKLKNGSMVCISELPDDISKSMYEELEHVRKKDEYLYTKTNIVRRAYYLELTGKLKDSGISRVKPKELEKALLESSFDIDKAVHYAMESIYTPLKLTMIEKREIEFNVSTMRHDMKVLKETKKKQGAPYEEDVLRIENKISASLQRHMILKKIITLAMHELRGRVVDAGKEKVSLADVRVSLLKNNWNVKDAYKCLVKSVTVG